MLFPEHTKIYSQEIPKFLYPFFEAKSIQRLHGIWQHCGTEYTKFFHYKFLQSRFNHSLWVALIIWHFSKDKKQTLAWFFHDISNSSFSHVWDFLYGDKLNQESTEELTSEIIQNDEIIQKELKKLWFKTSDIDDYTLYPIADNPWPQLSADRLEYTLTWWYNLWHISLKELKKIYNNIIILKNEKNEIELWFNNFDLALKLAELSIENDSKCFSSYMSNVSMSFLTEILKHMIEKNMIQKTDLFILQEQDIIQKITQSNDEKLKDMWKFFTSLNELKIHKEKPSENIFFIDSKNKKRYIDPLTKIWDEIKRVSEISKKFKIDAQNHKSYPLEWISIDYKI